LEHSRTERRGGARTQIHLRAGGAR
jgi:hypothetical protein